MISALLKNKFPFVLKLIIVLSGSWITSHLMAEEFRIAAINSERVLRDSNPAKSAQAKLQQEFSKRDKDLQEMASRLKALIEKQERDAPTLSDVERLKRQRELTTLESEYQRKQREFREDLNLRRGEEFSAVLERASRIIRQLAEQRKYDLIVQEAVYISPRIDITDEVIRTLNGGK